MFSALLKPKPLLDEASILWLFDTFDWAARRLDGGSFRARTLLVLPTNDFFPGRVNQARAMAQLIFERVVRYAAMDHWPLSLTEFGTCAVPLPGQPGPRHLIIKGPPRGAASSVSMDGAPHAVAYDPELIGNPEALIANLALSLAGLLAEAGGEPPPGGVENQAFAAEVLAVFMGFGLMMANSAKTIQVRSCGSCGGAQANRKGVLSQYDITYALALFCTLKDIAPKLPLGHLNKHLRPYFKGAMKDLQTRSGEVQALRALVRETD